MSFEIHIPSHTDDWGEQQPDRVVGTGKTEAAAFALRQRSTWSHAVASVRSFRRHPTHPYSSKVKRLRIIATWPLPRERVDADAIGADPPSFPAS
jgi:hypothetical protein